MQKWAVCCEQTVAWQGSAVLSKRGGVVEAAASEQVLRSAASSSSRLAIPLKAAGDMPTGPSRCLTGMSNAVLCSGACTMASQTLHVGPCLMIMWQNLARPCTGR